MFRMVLLSISVITLPLVTVTAHGVCFPTTVTVQKDDPYSYIASLIDALADGKQGLEQLSGNGSKQGYSSDLNFLISLKKGKEDYLCAASKVSPYKKSKSEIIRSSAEGADMVFTLLAKHNNDIVTQYSANLNSLNDGTFKPGTVMEKSAELMSSYDSTWKMLIPSVIMATYAVIEEDPKTHLMSRLALTSDQRDEIKSKLRSIFGDEIAKGMQVGQPSVTAAAAALYSVVGDPQRQTR